MEAVHEDGSMQCARHPFKNTTPAGGICASCLQEKLGKLVSSSYAVAVFPSSSSSSSPSSRSTYQSAGAALHHHHPKKSRLPFVSKKKTKDDMNSDMVFKRSNSTAAPGIHFFDQDYKPSFWKFLHFTSRKSDKHVQNLNFSSPSTAESREGEASFDRKVSRSRSVGCGSRSFSGFGDCTLRRVESQREGKCLRGGIFGGFGLTSSSSSSHLINAASDSSSGGGGGKSMSHSHGRSRSWGWALASPMRAFGKTSSALKRGHVSVSPKNEAPDIPSLVAVGD